MDNSAKPPLIKPDGYAPAFSIPPPTSSNPLASKIKVSNSEVVVLQLDGNRTRSRLADIVQKNTTMSMDDPSDTASLSISPSSSGGHYEAGSGPIDLLMASETTDHSAHLPTFNSGSHSAFSPSAFNTIASISTNPNSETSMAQTVMLKIESSQDSNKLAEGIQRNSTALSRRVDYMHAASPSYISSSSPRYGIIGNSDQTDLASLSGRADSAHLLTSNSGRSRLTSSSSNTMAPDSQASEGQTPKIKIESSQDRNKLAEGIQRHSTALSHHVDVMNSASPSHISSSSGKHASTSRSSQMDLAGLSSRVDSYLLASISGRSHLSLSSLSSDTMASNVNAFEAQAVVNEHRNHQGQNQLAKRIQGDETTSSSTDDVTSAAFTSHIPRYSGGHGYLLSSGQMDSTKVPMDSAYISASISGCNRLPLPYSSSIAMGSNINASEAQAIVHEHRNHLDQNQLSERIQGDETTSSSTDDVTSAAFTSHIPRFSGGHGNLLSSDQMDSTKVSIDSAYISASISGRSPLSLPYSSSIAMASNINASEAQPVVHEHRNHQGENQLVERIQGDETTSPSTDDVTSAAFTSHISRFSGGHGNLLSSGQMDSTNVSMDSAYISASISGRSRLPLPYSSSNTMASDTNASEAQAIVHEHRNHRDQNQLAESIQGEETTSYSADDVTSAAFTSHIPSSSRRYGSAADLGQIDSTDLSARIDNSAHLHAYISGGGRPAISSTSNTIASDSAASKVKENPMAPTLSYDIMNPASLSRIRSSSGGKDKLAGIGLTANNVDNRSMTASALPGPFDHLPYGIPISRKGADRNTGTSHTGLFAARATYSDLDLASSSQGEEAPSLRRANDRSSNDNDEGAFSGVQPPGQFPVHTPHHRANLASRIAPGSLANQSTTSGTALTPHADRSAHSNSSRLNENRQLSAPSTAQTTQVLAQSARYSQAHQNRTPGSTIGSAGGANTIRGAVAVRNASGAGRGPRMMALHGVFNPRTARAAQAVRGTTSTARAPLVTGISRPPARVIQNSIAEARSGRALYVPRHEMQNALANAAPESSRDAAARSARRAAEEANAAPESSRDAAARSARRAAQEANAAPESSRDAAARSARRAAEGIIKIESSEDDDNEQSDEDVLAQDLSKRSKEDAKTPILKEKGVVCEHVAGCNTNSPFRKAISNFFGRNKKCTRDIPDEEWVHYCRKHYQRCKFRDHDGWTRKLCEMIATQFDRIEAWSDANRAAQYGGVVTHWNIILRKREAERRAVQSAKKETTNRASATKKSKGKGRATSEDNDHDDSDGDDELDDKDAKPVPDWLVQYQGQNLTLAELREIFTRLRNEVCAQPGRELPDVEFLPNIRWIGGAKPAIVKYNKRKPVPIKGFGARKQSGRGKGKGKAPAFEYEDEDEVGDEYEDEDVDMDDDFEDVMVGSSGSRGGTRKRKRDAADDEDDEEYQTTSRARSTPVSISEPDVAQAMRTLQAAGFEVNRPQAPTPSQRHLYVRPPRAPAPDPSGITVPAARQPYIPRHARPAYTPPVPPRRR